MVHRHCFRTVFAAVVLSLPLAAFAEDSALKTDASGWTEVIGNADLTDWQRAGFVATRPLVTPSPWKYDPETKVLSCAGKGIHEMLLLREPKKDGIFHVEFRYPEVLEKVNSGVFVRTSIDGKYWHQAQLANTAIGVLFGPTKIGGADKRVSVGERMPELLRPTGEWNELEVTARGKEITLWINGKVTAVWNDCEIPEGCIGLEAEFAPIEFRNLKFKPLAASLP